MKKKFLFLIVAAVVLLFTGNVKAQYGGEWVPYVDKDNGKLMACFLSHPAGVECTDKRRISREEYNALLTNKNYSTRRKYSSPRKGEGYDNRYREQRQRKQNSPVDSECYCQRNSRDRVDRQRSENDVYQTQEERSSDYQWRVIHSRRWWDPSGVAVSGSRGKRTVTVRSNAPNWRPEIYRDDYGRRYYFQNGYRNYIR